ncbi:hypothetical protein [Mangrovicoccus ximenensis]|uniref:hypothetical protein n=1 Tax=Mangrovicoccus ximenensis TaxID=1911570 RepID=UPI001374C8EE
MLAAGHDGGVLRVFACGAPIWTPECAADRARRAVAPDSACAAAAEATACPTMAGVPAWSRATTSPVAG